MADHVSAAATSCPPMPSMPTCCGVAHVARHRRGRVVRLVGAAAGRRLIALALLHKLQRGGGGREAGEPSGLWQATGLQTATTGNGCMQPNTTDATLSTSPATHALPCPRLRHVLAAGRAVPLAPPQAAQRGTQLLEGGTHRPRGCLHLQGGEWAEPQRGKETLVSCGWAVQLGGGWGRCVLEGGSWWA